MVGWLLPRLPWASKENPRHLHASLGRQAAFMKPGKLWLPLLQAQDEWLLWRRQDRQEQMCTASILFFTFLEKLNCLLHISILKVTKTRRRTNKTEGSVVTLERRNYAAGRCSVARQGTTDGHRGVLCRGASPWAAHRPTHQHSFIHPHATWWTPCSRCGDSNLIWTPVNTISGQRTSWFSLNEVMRGCSERPCH